MKKKTIVLGVTGSIAAYKSCDIISSLKKEGFLISVIMTREAGDFIQPLTLRTLSQDRVYREMFEVNGTLEVEHISLAEKADLVLVAPATANIIGKLASGISDDLLTTTILATKAPVVICPAMNENMYKNRIVQENIVKLKRLGYKFIPPIKGRLACGKIGLGHLAEVSTIVKEVKRILK